MSDFELPKDLLYNRGMIQDPPSYAREVGCAGWLLLTGDEFAAMPKGIGYEQVQAAVSHSVQVISDPPRTLDLDLARRHVEALDELPRPTLVSCRTGPRASAVAYLYAGLKARARPESVLAVAREDDAPFCAFEEYEEWVRTSLVALDDECR